WEVTPLGLQLRHKLPGHSGWVGVVLSPDGRRAVTISWDNLLKFWDTTSGLEVGAIHSHGSGFAEVVFSRDGNRLYSASDDGEVRFWEAPPLERLQTKARPQHVTRKP